MRSRRSGILARLFSRRSPTSLSLTMVDSFVGTWKLVESKNFDDYMKSLGEQPAGLGMLGRGCCMPSLGAPAAAWLAPPCASASLPNEVGGVGEREVGGSG